MSQSRKRPVLQIPGGFRRLKCREQLTAGYMTIECENSGRVNNNRKRQEGNDRV